MVLKVTWLQCKSQVTYDNCDQMSAKMKFEVELSKPQLVEYLMTNDYGIWTNA